MEVLKPTAAKPLILNLPATIEAAMPNVYADQIEWMCKHISARDAVVISTPLLGALSASTYTKSEATASNTNRWKFKVQARSLTKGGVAQKYDMKYYALSGAAATLIGTDTAFTGGTKTLNFSGAAIPGFATAKTIDIRLDIAVPADDTVPAHSVSLTVTVPTK
jgi:hypothetical protein